VEAAVLGRTKAAFSSSAGLRDRGLAGIFALDPALAFYQNMVEGMGLKVGWPTVLILSLRKLPAYWWMLAFLPAGVAELGARLRFGLRRLDGLHLLHALRLSQAAGYEDVRPCRSLAVCCPRVAIRRLARRGPEPWLKCHWRRHLGSALPRSQT